MWGEPPLSTAQFRCGVLGFSVLDEGRATVGNRRKRDRGATLDEADENARNPGSCGVGKGGRCR